MESYSLIMSVDLSQQELDGLIIDRLFQLTPDELEVGIEHLHLSRATTEKFYKHKIYILDHLVNFLSYIIRGKLRYPTKQEYIKDFDLLIIQLDSKTSQKKQIKEQIIFLTESIHDFKISWKQYWQLINYSFTYFAAKLDKIGNLDSSDRCRPIEDLYFSKSPVWLVSLGIGTIGQFYDKISAGLPVALPASRLAEISDVVCSIVQYQHDESAFLKKPRRANFRQDNPGKKEPLNLYNFSEPSRLSSKARALSLSQIHLGNEVKHLNYLGIENLYQLVRAFIKGFPKSKGLGNGSLLRIKSILTAIDKSLNVKGDVDWDVFSHYMGFVLIPSEEKAINDGASFIASLESSIELLSTKCYDRVESLILKTRLISSPTSGKTLQHLGAEVGVSKERIRQKEVNIISSLSSALLEDSYPGVNFRFNQSFSIYWQYAALHFGDLKNISATEFVNGISTAWGVERASLIPFLPLIYAILTTDSILPKELQSAIVDLSKITNRIDGATSSLSGAVKLRGFRRLH